MPLAVISRWQHPVNRASWATGSRSVGESPSCVSASRDALQREKMRSRPIRHNSLRWDNLGVWVRRPTPQSPDVMYCRKSIAASFRLPSLPVRSESTPRCTPRQHPSWPSQKLECAPLLGVLLAFNSQNFDTGVSTPSDVLRKDLFGICRTRVRSE